MRAGLLGSAFPGKAFDSVPYPPNYKAKSARHWPVKGDAQTNAGKVGGKGLDRAGWRSEKSEPIWEVWNSCQHWHRKSGSPAGGL